jgi:hypothetical protein
MVTLSGHSNRLAPPSNGPINPSHGVQKEAPGRYIGGESTGRPVEPNRTRINRDPDAALAPPPQRPTAAARTPLAAAHVHSDATKAAAPLQHPFAHTNSQVHSDLPKQPAATTQETRPDHLNTPKAPPAKKQVTFNIRPKEERDPRYVREFTKKPGEDQPFVKVTKSPGRELQDLKPAKLPEDSYDFEFPPPKEKKSNLTRIAAALNPFSKREV